jgi:RHS repeat-associated protein
MNLGYTGKPYDSRTGLYNYGYRDYEPGTARFTTVDPVRDGSNWFAYVNNDPVNWVDPWGLEASDKKEPLKVPSPAELGFPPRTNPEKEVEPGIGGSLFPPRLDYTIGKKDENITFSAAFDLPDLNFPTISVPVLTGFTGRMYDVTVEITTELKVTVEFGKKLISSFIVKPGTVTVSVSVNLH